MKAWSHQQDEGTGAPWKDWWEIRRDLNYIYQNTKWFCLQRDKVLEMKTIQKAGDADCSVYKHLLDEFNVSLLQHRSHIWIAVFAWRQLRRCCLFAEQLPLTGTLILPSLLLLLPQSSERSSFIWRRTNKTSNLPHPDEWNAFICQKHFSPPSCRSKHSCRHCWKIRNQFKGNMLTESSLLWYIRFFHSVIIMWLFYCFLSFDGCCRC